MTLYWWCYQKGTSFCYTFVFCPLQSSHLHSNCMNLILKVARAREPQNQVGICCLNFQSRAFCSGSLWAKWWQPANCRDCWIVRTINENGTAHSTAERATGRPEEHDASSKMLSLPPSVIHDVSPPPHNKPKYPIWKYSPYSFSCIHYFVPSI